MASKKWYVIHTYSGHENKVEESLRHRIDSLHMKDMIFDIQIPTETVINKDDGKKQEIKLFPGYIFVQMILDDQSWAVVRHTPGVTGFVGKSGTSNSKPQPLSRDEVNRMLGKSKSSMAAPIIISNYEIGQTVRIRTGAFEDFDATVTEVNPDKGVLTCMVTLFGRETPVTLDFASVERI
ncbi:MAG: transcription termination/antitermination protein NusG [Coriobacteriia bacterium]|nr:transcription termination/antitermination protein NusG [Coriobacteriia bacterium]